MIIENLRDIFKRDLYKLRTEIAAYTTEANIWKTEGAITNAAGNLCLHLMGNLNTYIGAEFGKSGYVRNRELEFSLKDVAQSTLLLMIEQTIEVVDQSLSSLNDEDLNKEYPLLVFEQKTTTGYFLIHLTTHLSYHLGQINYHRRLID